MVYFDLFLLGLLRMLYASCIWTSFFSNLSYASSMISRMVWSSFSGNMEGRTVQPLIELTHSIAIRSASCSVLDIPPKKIPINSTPSSLSSDILAKEIQ